MIPIQHIIVALICFGAPFFTYFIHRYLRDHPSERIKEICYISVYLIYGLIAWFVAASRPLADSIDAPAIDLPWWLIVPGCLYLAYTLLIEDLSIWRIRSNPEYHARVRDIYDKMAWRLPRGRRQIAMFYGIATIVGIVEELFFRGYLTRYLIDFGLSWPAVAAVLAVLFGVGHFPQGWRYVVTSGLHGLMYWFLYAWTGSIWAPAVLHILYDARIGYISKVIANKSRL